MNSNSEYAPARLINYLRTELGADNDHDLATRLGMSPAVVGSLRTGRIGLSPSLLVLFADRIGSTPETLRRVVGERRTTARMSFPMPPLYRNN